MAAAEPDLAQIPFAVPHISNDELVAFFESHLSDAAVQTLSADFWDPTNHSCGEPAASLHEDEDLYEAEDDGLGYYPDGVKRTLTDEQIAIFRHSEIEALKREQERAAERRASAPTQHSEIDEAGTTDSPKGVESPHQPAKGAKNKKKRKAGKNTLEPKPDLRKRTWDVVEAGLDSLDYD